jgi:DNA-binding CsgD family transcriptional regulator
MARALIGRSAEIGAIRRFLDTVRDGAGAILLEGEAGIGKSALLGVAVQAAQARGFTVLTCSPAAAEARLSYGALADLLAPLAEPFVERLSPPLRNALDAALLRDGAQERSPDRRAAGAAALALLEDLATSAPVLVAIDDWQWLDRPSAQALAFASRRLRGPVGIAGARRIALGASASSAEPAAAGALGLCGGRPPHLITVGPLERTALRRLLRRHRSDLPSAMLARITSLSGGNPMFAIGLAGELPRAPFASEVPLPVNLQELVGSRLRGLGPEVRDALLVASALTRPTVALLEAALPDRDVEALLEASEEGGVVVLDGGAISFTHPLLAGGVYSSASASRRRGLHRNLASVVSGAEERARHMALGSISAKPEVIESLDRAAGQARERAAPAAAAELLEMALALGAGTDERLVRVARMHFEAGAIGRARELLETAIANDGGGAAAGSALGLLGTIRHRDDSFEEAAQLMQQALATIAPSSTEWIDLALELCWVLTNLANTTAALPYAQTACEAAEASGDRGLHGEALAVRTTVRYMLGQGLDEGDLQRALALEESERRTLVWHRPSMLACLVYASIGRLEDAWTMLTRVRATCAARGEDAELVYTVIHGVQLSLLRGQMDEARAFVKEAQAHSALVETGTAAGIALWAKAALGAWEGRVREARSAAEASLALFQKNGSIAGALLPIATLGQLSVAMGDSAAAASCLAPLALGTVAGATVDPTTVPWTADAAEALIGQGRNAEATTIVDWLERRGAELDRPWAVAVGARYRGLLQTASADLTGAARSFERALGAHARLGVDFERARTLIAVADMHRRARRRKAASEALEQALDAFEALGARPWAARAKGDLGRVLTRRAPASDELTPAERRVALLAASGLTNRAAAEKLFVSPKTVEATLARVYRKLGIGSRAELGANAARLKAGEGPTQRRRNDRAHRETPDVHRHTGM